MRRGTWGLAVGAAAIAATLFGTAGLGGEAASQVFLVLGAGVALALSRSPRRE